MRTNRPGIGADAFARLVEQAIARIPEELRAYLDNVVISVKRRPGLDLLAEMGLAPDEPLFGVYIGVALTERGASEPPLYPDAIHIFQEPLEACCATREELLEEIEAVLNRKLYYLSLPETLKQFFLRGKHNLVVTGTHGKTTTTSLLAWSTSA